MARGIAVVLLKRAQGEQRGVHTVLINGVVSPMFHVPWWLLRVHIGGVDAVVNRNQQIGPAITSIATTVLGDGQHLRGVKFLTSWNGHYTPQENCWR